MNKLLLITRPNYDLTTNYLFHWSKFVIKEAKNKRIKVLDLKGKKVNKKDLGSYIKKHKPKLVFFNGHGSIDTIFGHNDEVLIKVNQNEKLLLGKIVYSRSCDSGKKLGPECVKKGATAFIGYKRKYLLGYSQSKISQPLKDKIAKLFLQPSNLVVISLLKGNTVKVSYEKSQKTMLRNFYYMLSKKASHGERDAAPYLWTDRKYQVVHGNKSAKM